MFRPCLPQRRSIRLPAYDYGDPGAYFVTICTHERQCLLEDPRRIDAVRTAWTRGACGGRRPPDYEFVVMPNHVHGIIWIAGASVVRARHVEITTEIVDQPATPVTTCQPVSRGASPLRVAGCATGSLGALVGAFKAASARRINDLRGSQNTPVWQRNYYERVLRDDRELELARAYILDNPRKWAEDKNNPANLANIS